MEQKRVGIVLFEDIEVLDFCGPFEVFSAARLNEACRREESSPFEVLLVAERPGPVVATGGLTVLPHFTFEDCPRLDVVVVPGGWGTRRELHNPVLLDWLRKRAAEAETLTAVCTGSMLLAFAGISAGIDMALKVVERYLGEDISRATARHMEFPYPESDARRIRL